jgi:hypothetical protein
MVPVVVMSLASCGGRPSAATTATVPCSARPTATAIAWDENGQVHGSINGASPNTLSTFKHPLGLPGESGDNPARLGALAVAPDAAHVAVEMLVPGLDAPGVSYPYLVDAATHAVTRIALPRYPSALGQTGRLFAWVDAHTLIVFAGVGSGSESDTPGGPATYRYDLTTGSATRLPGMANAVEGAVHCSTVYWLGLSSLAAVGQYMGAVYYRGHVQLHRYDLATGKEIGQPLALGETAANDGGPWGVDWPGWDVSADGTRIVYQQMHITFDGMQDIASSTFRLANADGSDSRIIFAGPLTVMLAGAARLAISPDGRQVALTESPTNPAAVSGAVAGSDGFKSYSPAGIGQPAWLPDGTGFVATAKADPSFAAGIYQYWPGTPALGQGGTIPGIQLSLGGTNPATLI